jgi:hypothetical protein
MIQKLLLTGFKYGHIKGLVGIEEHIDRCMFCPMYCPELPIIGVGDNDLLSRFVHYCVLYAIKHDFSLATLLLEYLTKHFNIYHGSTLKEIIVYRNKTIFNNIMRKINVPTDIPIGCDESLLYLLCEYSGDKFYIIRSTNVGYEYFMKLIGDNLKTYTPDIIRQLLVMFVKAHSIKDENINTIYEWIMMFENSRLISDIILNKANPKLNILLVPKAYEYNLKLDFLKESKELNMLSIEQAIKNNTTKQIYTDKLSNEGIANKIHTINNIDIQKHLLLKINGYGYSYDRISNDVAKQLIDWVMEINDLDCTSHLIKCKVIDDEMKIPLLPKAYEYNMIDYMEGVFKCTKELNVLTIEKAIKNNNTKNIYTNKLSNDEIAKFVIGTENVEIKKYLVLKIIGDGYGKCKDIMNDDMAKQLIEWTIQIDDKDCIRYLIVTNSINNNIKIPLIPKAYEYINTIYHISELLKSTKELNIMSIEQSIKYGKREVYIDKLTIQEVLNYIVNTNGIVRKDLIFKLYYKEGIYDELDDKNYIQKTGMTYIVKQDRLPKHYKFNDEAKQWKDKKIVFNCKVKINKKIKDVNYTKLLLDVDPDCYHDIIEEIAIGYAHMRAYETIMFLIDHPKFNEVKPSIVVKLLCRQCDEEQIVVNIIKNHNFFRQFDKQL